MENEIERQFLLSEIPQDLKAYPSVKIQQGYLSVTEDREVRLREESGVCTLTVKSGQGSVRQEIETIITKQQFEDLWPATESRRLIKTRYFYPVGAYEAHVDIYEDKLTGLNVAEIEFDSVSACQAFRPPDYFGEEVTDIGGFYHLDQVMNKL